MTSMAVRHISAVMASLCACTTMPGVLLATACVTADAAPASVLAQCCAALATLAADGSFILELPSVADPLTLCAAALCGRHFGDVSLFRPVAMPAATDGVFLVAQRFAQLSREQLSALVDTLTALEASSGVSKAAGAAAAQPQQRCGFLAEAAIPAELRLNWEDACAWAERRASSDAALARQLSALDTTDAHAGVARRWTLMHGAEGVSAAKVHTQIWGCLSNHLCKYS